MELARRLLHAFQQLQEIPLDNVAADRFGVLVAVTVEAEIVRVVGAPGALAPARRERAVTAPADNTATEGEVLPDVLPARRSRLTSQDALNLLEGPQADERRMTPFPQADAPIWCFQISRIGRVGQEPSDALVQNLALVGARKDGMGLKEAFDLCLNLKPPAGKPFQSFLHDGSERFVPHQDHAALSVVLDVRIACWSAEHGVAPFEPRLHLLARLPRSLLTLELTARDRGGLVVAALRRVLEPEVRGLRYRAIFLKLPHQGPIEFGVAADAAEIVKDHDISLVFVRRQMGQQLFDARAVQEMPARRLHVRKDGLNHVPAPFGVPLKAIRLAILPIPARFLSLV